MKPRPFGRPNRFNLASVLIASALSICLFSLLAVENSCAAELEASDGEEADRFGASVQLSGAMGLVGAYVGDAGASSNQGSAYLFRNLDTSAGTVFENAKLIASDGATEDSFGISASVSGSTGLVGASGDDFGPNFSQGSAYVFRDLDIVSGTVTQNAKLTASDGASFDFFGYASSLSGGTGLVGAYGDTIGANVRQGSAYVFRSLDTATGTITQNAKLIASDGATEDLFGSSASLSGNTGLVGAYTDDVGANTAQGSAYLFRDLDTAAGTVTEDAKLIASDGAATDVFGLSVSLSANEGLVGAYGDDVDGNVDQGSAYLFRNLDTATGTVTQDLKLIASDGTTGDSFGRSVSLSGSVGLVGAFFDSIGGNSNQGSAYLFRDLDTATGTVTQSVKIMASSGTAGTLFGISVSLSGDQFVIGASHSGNGKAYTGSVSSVTTLDAGSTSRTIDGLSFISQDDWIVGQTTDSNQVNLTAGDAADVTAFGKEVYIGQEAGSDNNILNVSGTMTSNEVYIGSLEGNSGNTLALSATADFTTPAFRLAPENFLTIEGDYSDTSDLLTYLGATSLQVWDGLAWETVTLLNSPSLISSTFDSGTTTVQVVPEPTAALLLLLGAGGMLLRRRKA